MITADNFKTVLVSCLGFSQADMQKTEILTREFRHMRDGSADCVLSVDFGKRRFGYEEAGIDIGGGTTVSFAPDSAGKVQNENFVVFECVVRLLAKGYRASDIFLEKRHTLGHTQKSGRLDITVVKDGNAYLIIECKTAGSQYKKARKELLSDSEGKQLFSYWAQSRSAQWLQLYSSDYDATNNAIVVDEEIVRSHDDRNVELLASKDAAILLYKNASEATDAWRVWDETYHKETYKNLIFGQSCVAYNIGIRPLLKQDLRKFSQEDGFTNTFREILRHNAISDKENAFNKLLSLFICKFVDEARCSGEEVVAFQYKDGEDDYYSLYERLLALFQIGMKDYLKEEVFYLENDYIAKTLDSFTGKKRKALEAELKDKFQKTKMLSCQVFAFREVYNETLFLQNGKVLVEIVKLMQQYQFAYSSKEQLLGDLFENLLKQGFKQEAGQFFTPTPITRFVWNALPYERFLNCAKESVPRVIDFACGSGHFLTEGISAVSDFYRTAGVPKERFTDAAISRRFFGIEKDNRLAKVSKIALILNGALEGRIKADDGLTHDEDFLGKKHTFDILVANPPYSVDSFKTHEPVSVQKSYETLALMSLASNRIQNVFVERMEHLLKSGGIAAIVLPPSFLTTEESDTNKAREILLRNFVVRAIVEFGNKAFAETTTTTIILFLEHLEFPPNKASLLNDTADAILSGEELSDWEDREIFSAYLEKIGVAEKDYQEAMVGNLAPDELAAEYFRAYAETLLAKGIFAKDIEKAAKETDPAKKIALQQRIKERFYDALKEIERAKIIAFALTYKQKTVIVKSPTDNDEQEKFLGYRFSKGRNSEGLRESETNQLTNRLDRADKTKIAYAIKNAFADDYVLPKGMEYVSVVNTVDMLDFSRPKFDQAISLSPHRSTVLPPGMVHLENDCNYVTERIPFDAINAADYITTDNMLPNREGIIAYSGNPISGSVIKYKKGDILISNIRPYLKKIWLADKGGGCSPDVLILRSVNEKKVLPEYLFACLSADEFFDYVMEGKSGVKMPRGDKDQILRYPIKDVDVSVQRQIVGECARVDAACAKQQKVVADGRSEIVALVETVSGGKVALSSVCTINDDALDPHSTPDTVFTYVDIDAVENGTGIISYDQKMTGRVLPSRARRLAKVGDVIISTVRPNLKGFAYIDRSPADCIYSTGFAVLRGNPSKLVGKYLFSIFMYSQDMLKQMTDAMPKGQYPSVNKADIERFTFPLPTLAEQKKLADKIDKIESKIAAAKVIIASAAEKKSAILDRYLK